MTDGCWSCGNTSISSIFSIQEMALSSLILVDSREEAVNFPQGDLELVVCRACGFIFNRKFRPELIDYTMPYESSQIFSPRFRAFAKELIDHLATDYDLVGKEVLEIGCGDGSFLEALCRVAGARGFGIDPTFDAERIADDVDVSGLARFYDESQTHLTGDLICCRHTLEHIQPVAEFVSWVRESASRRPGTVVFFEVPDSDRILDEGAFWDVYNEHCSYFTRSSLSNLFRSRGYQVLRLNKGFDDQYLLIDAVAAEPDASVNRAEVDHVVGKAERFGASAGAAVRGWQELVDHSAANGKKVTLWGASSKAVAFLAAVGRNQGVAAAVDINPFKQDKYLPGSGVAVIAPEALVDLKPDIVIVMNPIYLDEIKAQLVDLGLAPEVRYLGEKIDEVPA